MPRNHLAHYILDAVEELDLFQVRVNHRGTGRAQFPPAMMTALLIYGYATGTFSSRQIERATYENLAVRMLSADTHPDHDTLCTFRRQNQALLSECFVRVLEMAQRLKLLKVGQITVSVDGTKVLAHASKHAAARHQRAGQQIERLEAEVRQLLAKAEQANHVPLEEGLSISEEIARRQERKAALAKARAPSATPEPTEQYNFTDPPSRIMKAGSGQHFEQSYNTQAAVMVVERTASGQPTGVTVYAAVEKTGHHRSVADLEERVEPAPPPTGASVGEVMRWRLRTAAGRALYRLRQQTVEPVFGIIKEVMGFRRFLLRGLEKVNLEWTLVCLAYNFKRLHRLAAAA